MADATTLDELTQSPMFFYPFNLLFPTFSGTTFEGLSWDPCTASPATTCGKNANPLNAREKLPPTRSCSSARRSTEDQPDHSSGQQPLKVPFSVQLSGVVHVSNLSLHQPPMTITRHQAIMQDVSLVLPTKANSS